MKNAGDQRRSVRVTQIFLVVLGLLLELPFVWFADTSISLGTVVIFCICVVLSAVCFIAAWRIGRHVT